MSFFSGSPGLVLELSKGVGRRRTSHQHPLATVSGGCCGQHLCSLLLGQEHPGRTSARALRVLGRGKTKKKGQFSVVISISPCVKESVSSFLLPSRGAELPNTMRKLWQAVFAGMEVCRASGGPGSEHSEEADSPFLGC